MRKADRLFQLTNIIRVRQPITAAQLSEELEVSVRTIYRYIDDLSASGIPIYGTAGLGYQLLDHFELPPLNLNEKELEALILGVNMVSSWTSEPLSQAATALRHKIEAAIPPNIIQKHAKTIFTYNLTGDKKDKHVWEILHQAIVETRLVNISYEAANQEETSRTIAPLGLFYWGGKWTVGSWCLLRQDFRDFRLDRVEHIKIGEHVDKQQTPDLVSYFAVRGEYY